MEETKLVQVLDQTCFQLILKQSCRFLGRLTVMRVSKQASAVGDVSYKTQFDQIMK